MILGLIQARMSSQRLPGKVLELLGGKPMIECQIERTAFARLDELLVATSTEARDTPLCTELERIGARFFRGALDDVLDRVYRAAVSSGAHHVVRLTADCPLIDYRIVDRVLEAHLAEGNDYSAPRESKCTCQSVPWVRIPPLSANKPLPPDRDHSNTFAHAPLLDDRRAARFEEDASDVRRQVDWLIETEAVRPR